MKRINSKIFIEGIIEYIDSYIIPNIEDNFLKVALKTYIVSAATKAPIYEKLIKDFLKKSFIQDVFDVKDDTFDIELLISSLQTAIKECGDLKIVFPPIKFLSPEEKILTFNTNDIADFKEILIKLSNKE